MASNAPSDNQLNPEEAVQIAKQNYGEKKNEFIGIIGKYIRIDTVRSEQPDIIRRQLHFWVDHIIDEIKNGVKKQCEGLRDDIEQMQALIHTLADDELSLSLKDLKLEDPGFKRELDERIKNYREEMVSATKKQHEAMYSVSDDQKTLRNSALEQVSKYSFYPNIIALIDGVNTTCDSRLLLTLLVNCYFLLP